MKRGDKIKIIRMEDMGGIDIGATKMNGNIQN